MEKLTNCLKGSVILGASLLVGCVSDPNYELDKLDNIDTSVNIFGDGIEIPLGKTEQITLADALRMAKLDISKEDSFIKKDENGNYSISVSGDYKLDDVIKDLHLEDLGNINGASFSKEVEYKLGDFDPDQFKIEGLNFSYAHEGFCDVNLDDIPMPTISSNSEIKTELYKYLPQDMDISGKVGNFEFSETLLEKIGEKIVLPGILSDDEAIPVQEILEGLGLTEFNIDYRQGLDTGLSLGDNADKIADVRNFKLKNGGLLKVEFEIENCPLDGGSLVPDLDLDISSMLSLSGAVDDKVDLSSMVLNSENSWKTSKDISIAALASGFPEFDAGTLALKGLININGVLKIQNATAKPGTIKGFAYADMKLKAKVFLNGVKLDEMDITLADGVGYTASDVSVPVDIKYDLPTGVAEVKKVYFQEDKKLSVTIDASGLNGIKSTDGSKHLSIIPDVEITFPDNLEIKEAENNKVKISGLDLADGDITKDFTLVSVTPVNSSKKLSFNGQVTAKASATASGTFSSKNLPASVSTDLVIKTAISCTPGLKDYKATLAKDEVTKKVDETREFTFPMEGMADFGTFNIIPKDSPRASLVFTLPFTHETDIVADKLVISIPEMIGVNGSAITIDGNPIGSVSGCDFDSVLNTITLNGKIPGGIVIPIKDLTIVPKAGDDGKTEVKGIFRIAGGISVSNLEITRITFEDINHKRIEVKAVIPSIEAQSIEMTGDFNKSLDYEGKDIVILDSEAMKNIPEQVKSLDEVTLDNVNALIEIKVDGLPDMNGSKFVLKDTKIQLPDFLFGENDSHTLVLPAQIEITDGTPIVQKAQLTKLANIQLAGKTEITGDIKLEASLYANKPSVDLSTLKNTIKATVKIGVGDGENADNPGKIAISKARVKVGYELEQKQSLAFEGIPAELKGEGINLALNPEMHLELSTNFGAPVKGDIILTPIIADVAKEPIPVPGIELPYSDDGETVKVNKYAIGNSATVAPDEQEIKTDLSKLLTQIPDAIDVAIKVKIDETEECVIYPGANYTCGMKYDLKVPLNFGEGFNINLNADIDVDASVSDYLKFADEAKLGGTYLTTLPIGATVEISLLGPDDKPIELLDPEDRTTIMTHLTLALDKSGDGKTAKEGTLGAELIFKDKANVNLKKVHLGIKVDASENVNLNEEQYIQITNLCIGLPKGVNVEIQKEK